MHKLLSRYRLLPAFTLIIAALVSASCSKGTTEPPASPSGAPASPAGTAGGGDANRPALPSGHPPVDGGAAGGGAPQGGLVAWTVPAGWKEETPTSKMRYAQFRVSGVDGDPEDAECAVFYFGAGQGGSPKDNAARWVGQFVQPDGSSSESRSKTEVKTVNGKEVMFVEVTGTYTASMAGMQTGEPKKDYALIGAIVPGPDAPWFFKLTGPKKTVEANREAFTALVTSVH